MIIGRRQDFRLAVDAFDLVEQKLRVAPSFTSALLVLRQPARTHIAESVDQEFHVRRWFPQDGLAGVPQGAPEQQVGGRRFLRPVGDDGKRHRRRRRGARQSNGNHLGAAGLQARIETCQFGQALRREGLRVEDQTPGGVFEVQWNMQGKSTAMGQLAFFAEFLQVSGLFENWLQSCPLRYTSPNAPEVQDVLGTWLLGILDGHSRYAHIGALRGDGVAPEVLAACRT